MLHPTPLLSVLCDTFICVVIPFSLAPKPCKEMIKIYFWSTDYKYKRYCYPTQKYYVITHIGFQYFTTQGHDQSSDSSWFQRTSGSNLIITKVNFMNGYLFVQFSGKENRNSRYCFRLYCMNCNSSSVSEITCCSFKPCIPDLIRVANVHSCS